MRHRFAILPGDGIGIDVSRGSAPDIAGSDRANPIAAVLTAAMMLDHVGLADEAALIEAAVVSCMANGESTADIGGKLGTAAAGDAIAKRILQQSGAER